MRSFNFNDIYDKYYILSYLKSQVNSKTLFGICSFIQI
jgi:hypothetical protein